MVQEVYLSQKKKKPFYPLILRRNTKRGLYSIICMGCVVCVIHRRGLGLVKECGNYLYISPLLKVRLSEYPHSIQPKKRSLPKLLF